MIGAGALRIAALVAVVASALIVTVVATAFAVFYGLRPFVGEAGAAAVVAGLCALVAGIIALVAAGQASSRPEKSAPATDTLGGFDLSGLGLTERIGDLVRERPLVATGVALVVGLIAFRNPELVTMIARSFLKPARSSDDRR